jgi:hypothetical protein
MSSFAETVSTTLCQSALCTSLFFRINQNRTPAVPLQDLLSLFPDHAASSPLAFLGLYIRPRRELTPGLIFRISNKYCRFCITFRKSLNY